MRTPPDKRCSYDMVREETNFPRYHQCMRRGTVTREGKLFCGQHDPKAVDRREEIRQAKFDAFRRNEHRKWLAQTIGLSILSDVEDGGAYHIPDYSTTQPKTVISRYLALKLPRCASWNYLTKKDDNQPLKKFTVPDPGVPVVVVRRQEGREAIGELAWIVVDGEGDLSWETSNSEAGLFYYDAWCYVLEFEGKSIQI